MERFTEEMFGDGGMTHVWGRASGTEARLSRGLAICYTGLCDRLRTGLLVCAFKYKQVECKYVPTGPCVYGCILWCTGVLMCVRVYSWVCFRAWCLIPGPPPF